MEDKTTDKLMSRISQWQSAVGQSWTSTPDDTPTTQASPVQETADPVVVMVAEAVVEPVQIEQIEVVPAASPRESWSHETIKAAKPAPTITIESEAKPASAPNGTGHHPQDPQTLHYEAVARERTSELFGERVTGKSPTGHKPQPKRIKLELTSERRRELKAAILMCAAILVLVLTILLTTSYRG